jgi:hypothetical protein
VLRRPLAAAAARARHGRHRALDEQRTPAVALARPRVAERAHQPCPDLRHRGDADALLTDSGCARIDDAVPHDGRRLTDRRNPRRQRLWLDPVEGGVEQEDRDVLSDENTVRFVRARCRAHLADAALRAHVVDGVRPHAHHQPTGGGREVAAVGRPMVHAVLGGEHGSRSDERARAQPPAAAAVPVDDGDHPLATGLPITGHDRRAHGVTGRFGVTAAERPRAHRDGDRRPA